MWIAAPEYLRDGTGMKILLVEPDPAAMRALSNLLTSENYRTLRAQSVREAIHWLESDAEIQLIISALSMPDADGFELLKYRRANRRFHKIPVLMCSSSGDSQSVVHSIELGARDFLIKPVRKVTLLPKVQKAIMESIGSVLLVESDGTILDLLIRIVERDGYRTYGAKSAEEALELMQKNRVSVVISDMAMPGMSGLELMAKVKEKYPKVPVLLITGQTGEFTREKAIAAGADGHISRPFKNVEILRKLTSLGV